MANIYMVDNNFIIYPISVDFNIKFIYFIIHGNLIISVSAY